MINSTSGTRHQGPDKDTRNVLAGNYSIWLLETWSLRATSKEEMHLDLDAQAQIVQFYVRARGDDA